MKRKIAVVIGVILIALSFVACDENEKDKEYQNDVPRAENNTAPADVIAMPDGFSNAATKCDHGNRIYTLFHNDSPYGAIAVVANDPSCDEGAK